MTPTVARLVVFTGDLSYSVRRGIVDIDDAVSGLQWLVVVHAPRKPAAQLIRNQRVNLRRHGWRWIPYQTADAWRRLARRGHAPTGSTAAPGRGYDLDALAVRPNVRVVRVGDLHGSESLAIVRDFAADLGLSLAAPILRRPLFSLPRVGTLNLHKGKLPLYRGMPPAFWELWHDEATVGCSVHWVDDGLDTGAVVARAEIDRERYSTLRGLQIRLDEIGAQLMVGAVESVLSGACTAEVQPSHGGRTFRKPTLAQVEALDRKMARLQPAAGSSLRRSAKELSLAAAYAVGSIVRRHVVAPRITVLLYHRVSDDARDNLTVGVEQFDRQMALLRRNCEVISIAQLLACESVGRSARPIVAVTFDDGYLDNFQNAAPILRRNGVPASFYVSTGIIDSQGRFPHDVRRGNAALPVMNWDQLRKMRDWGFEIGSHSVSHIDCASESEAVVRAELAVSRERLRDELAVGGLVFAYPYGGKRHITAERLKLVREAGYVGCLAAYGGANVGGVDPFNVLRRGIHWEYSDRAFLFECLGFRP